jgi:hypothetical protein
MVMPIALWALLWFGIATIWVEGRWAVSALGVGTFLLSAVTVLRNRWKVIPHWTVGCLATVAAWGMVQIALRWTVAPAQTEWAILYWMAAACFAALGTLIRDREHFLNGLLWFGAVTSILTLAQLYTSKGQILWFIPTHEQDRIFGTFPNHNHYAAFMELLFPLALWRTLQDRGNGWLYAGVASLMYGSVIASASRAGTMLITLELAAVLVLAVQRGMPGRHSGSRLILVLAGVIGFAWVAGPEAVWQRLWTPDPYAMRREYLESAIAMLRERPLRGFGLGAWTSAYPAYAVADFGVIANHAHSEWGQWGAEGGVGVVAIMAALFVLSLRKGVRNVWALGLAAVMLHALVDYPLARLGLGSWWFVMLGIAAGEDWRPRNSELANRAARQLQQPPS